MFLYLSCKVSPFPVALAHACNSVPASPRNIFINVRLYIRSIPNLLRHMGDLEHPILVGGNTVEIAILTTTSL